MKTKYEVYTHVAKSRTFGSLHMFVLNHESEIINHDKMICYGLQNNGPV